jgi:TonB-linked SusC/RagA family outer membrane protein
MRRLLVSTILLLLFGAGANAQAVQVSGRILDSANTPLVGASVREKGTKTGVSASSDGTFSVNVKPGATLVVSAIGYATREVAAASGMTVIMIPDQAAGNLNEVVVTALGVRRSRNTLPYSAQQVNGEDLSRQRSSNFINNLAGKVSGLELRQSNTLGGSTNITLRGFKSISGNNQPLFVVDGVPVDNSVPNTADQRTGRGGYDYGNIVADINPDDIESLTVLKGAASTALYGERGGNGVIMITTKKGARGLGITFNSSITAGKYDPTTFAKYQKEYGGGYGQYYEDSSGFFLYRDVNGDGVKDLVVPTSEDASYGGAFNPNKLVYLWDAFDPTSPYYGKPHPWMAAANDPSYIFKTQLSHNQSLFITGGSDKGTFKVGYTRTDDNGVMPNSRISKNLINFNSTYNVTDRLTVGALVNFTNTVGRGRYGTGYDDKNLMTNFRQWWQVNTDLKDQKDAYFRNRNNVTWNWADPTDLVPIYWDNPYFSRYENYETDVRNRYFGNVNVNYKIANGFSVLGRASIDNYSLLQEERQAVGSVSVPYYRRYNQNFTENNYDLIFNFDKNVTQDLNLKALLGGTIRTDRSNSVYASTNGGLIVPRIYALSNTTNAINAPVETDIHTQVNSQYGNASLTWREMITVDGSLRFDQSSTLPKGNNRFSYYSVSGGFIFSKLLPDLTWLQYGKVRGNYAEVGSGTSAYSTLPVYDVGTAFGANPQTSLPTTQANNTLRPERTKSIELGIEAAFAKGRAGFDVTYYNARSIDQIFAVSVSTSTGYGSRFLNSGTIRNQGFEVSAYVTPVQSKNFSWTLNANWTRNRNKVLDLYTNPGTGLPTDNIVLGSFQGGVTINATLGQPYGTIRGSNFVYTNGQKTVGANGRYVISTTSNEVIGNQNPDWIGGLNNTLKYKNWSLSWLIDVRKGGDVFSLDLYYGLATGLYPETAGLNDLGNPKRAPLAQGGGIVREGVLADGKPNTTRVSAVNYGAYGYVYSPAASFVYDAGFVKLREVSLAYSLPQSLFRRIRAIKGIDLSLVGRNLWLIHKNLPYADPEEIVSAGNLQGYQGGAYPLIRTLTFNVKARF